MCKLDYTITDELELLTPIRMHMTNLALFFFIAYSSSILIPFRPYVGYIIMGVLYILIIVLLEVLTEESYNIEESYLAYGLVPIILFFILLIALAIYKLILFILSLTLVWMIVSTTLSIIGLGFIVYLFVAYMNN